MSEEEKASGDLPNDSENTGAEVEGTVAYSSYQKLLSERKRDREKARSAEAQLAEIQNQLLIAEGDKDKMLEASKVRYERAENDLKELKTQVVSDKVNNQIRSAAKEHGCVNTDKYLKLIGGNELDSIKGKVDDNYNIDQQALSELIEKSKKEHEDIGLFKKTDVKVHDVNSGHVPRAKAKTVDEMSVDDLKAAILKKK